MGICKVAEGVAHAAAVAEIDGKIDKIEGSTETRRIQFFDKYLVRVAGRDVANHHGRAGLTSICDRAAVHRDVETKMRHRIRPRDGHRFTPR